MTRPLVFEFIDDLVRVSGSTPPKPGAQLIVVDDDGGAMLCEVDVVSVTDDGWGLELRNLPWPDGWSVHKRGEGHEIHRPATTKEDDQ